MKRDKFFALFTIPYLCLLLSLIVAKPLSSHLYRTIASPQEIGIREYPFKFDVPEINKPSIPEDLKSPFRIAKKESPEPFAFDSTLRPEEPTKVTLVVVGESFRLAIINGIVIKEGDTFQNGRVLRIREDKVVISEKGRIKEIPVPPYKP